MTFTKEQLKLLLHCVEIEYTHVGTVDSAWYIWRVLGLYNIEKRKFWTAQRYKNAEMPRRSLC